MPAHLLFLGFDAAESTLLERWAGEGLLPSFAALIARSARCALETPLETLPGAIWPEIVTGRSGGRLGHFYHPRQIHTGEAELRRIEAADVDASQYSWSAASRAGCRVAVIDLPQVVPTADLNGVQVFEWGCHDRHFQIGSTPPELIDELVARHGDHPIRSCDHFHGRAHEGYERLLEALVTGVRRKTELILDVLGRETWDLFACAFSESHCAGHQLWSFHDPQDPGHAAQASPALKGALRSVYQELDRALGRILEAAGADAEAVVVASHGMGLKTAGPQLLPEVLKRLGLYTPKQPGDLRVRLRDALPRGMRARVRSWLPARSTEKLAPLIGQRPQSLTVPGVRAIAVPNNRCGGIRLNLKGREPQGCVEPGAAAGLCDELRRELLALRDPASGEPIVKRVQTAQEVFGAGHHPDLPDLIVVFRGDLGLLEVCESPRVGRVEVTARPVHPPRSGDHRPSSRLWARGPGFPGATLLPPHNVLDITPTLLEMLGVAPPADCDGQAIREIVRSARAAGTRRTARV